MVNWNDNPWPEVQAPSSEHAPDGAGLGLACGCLIFAAVAALLVVGFILGAALS